MTSGAPGTLAKAVGTFFKYVPEAPQTSSAEKNPEIFNVAQYRRHWNSGTQAGKYIKMMIPLKPLDYNVTGIGHVEADTSASLISS